MWTKKENGERVHLRQFETGYEEAEYIASEISKNVANGSVNYRDNAILYRTNAQSRLLEEKFILFGIPYDVVGGINFYSRREIKDILAYLKTIDNGKDDLAVKRIINVPRRGIGATSLNRVQQFAIDNDMSLFDALLDSEYVPGLGAGKKKLDAFTNMIRVFRAKALEMSVDELIHCILDETGYLAELEASDDPDADDRIENIEELITKAKVFSENYRGENEKDSAVNADGVESEVDISSENAKSGKLLSAFLEEVALVADIDRVDSDGNKVLLMTLHAAKGLEFPRVYMAGMEDGLFPSYMTIVGDDEDELEEERRLCYVGITRAMDELTLTYAKSRMVRGEMQFNAPSRFIREMPALMLDNKLPGRRNQEENSSGYGSAKESGNPKAKVDIKPFILQADAMTKGKDLVKSDGLEYNVGDRVSHIKFGVGEVVSIVDGGRDFEVTVDFEKYGIKKMFAAFAKLKKV